MRTVTRKPMPVSGILESGPRRNPKINVVRRLRAERTQSKPPGMAEEKLTFSTWRNWICNRHSPPSEQQSTAWEVLHKTRKHDQNFQGKENLAENQTSMSSKDQRPKSLTSGWATAMATQHRCREGKGGGNVSCGAAAAQGRVRRERDHARAAKPLLHSHHCSPNPPPWRAAESIVAGSGDFLLG